MIAPEPTSRHRTATVGDAGRLTDLTERQRQCLRLVGRGYEFKDIARELGISDATVKQHLRAARETLCVARSVDAARLLAASELTETSAWGASPPRPMAAHPDNPADPPSQLEGAGDRFGGLRDSSWSMADQVHRNSWTIHMPFPTRSGQRNRLGLGSRIVLVSLLLVALIASVGFFVQASIGLSGH